MPTREELHKFVDWQTICAVSMSAPSLDGRREIHPNITYEASFKVRLTAFRMDSRLSGFSAISYTCMSSPTTSRKSFSFAVVNTNFRRLALSLSNTNFKNVQFCL